MKLSSVHTIADYHRAVASEDRAEIVKLIRLRLTERYVNPVVNAEARHGFAMMALACLLIETIQCFREGLAQSGRKGRKVFIRYFADERNGLKEVKIEGGLFYRDIRCGILHQGETYGGWRVSRTGKLFDPVKRRINAKALLLAVHASLDVYCDELRQVKWDEQLWQNCRNKMDAIVFNCALPTGESLP
jgi:hypothetical protein